MNREKEKCKIAIEDPDFFISQQVHETATFASREPPLIWTEEILLFEKAYCRSPIPIGAVHAEDNQR